MRLRIAAVAAILPALFLGACATSVQVHQPLPLAARDLMRSVDVVAPAAQSEMTMGLQARFNPMILAVGIPGMSVLGAAIAGGIAGAAEPGMVSAAQQETIAALAPLNTALADYRLEAAFESELKTSLSQVSWLRTGAIKVFGPGRESEIETAITGSGASAVLFTPISYHLSADADELIMIVQPRVLPGSAALRSMLASPGPKDLPLDPANALYRNVLTYRTGLVGANSVRAENIAKWAANNGATARGAMQLGVQKLSHMLAYNLATEGDTVDSAKAGLKSVKVNGAKGYILTSDSTGHHILLETGEHVYLTTSSPSLNRTR